MTQLTDTSIAFSDLTSGTDPLEMEYEHNLNILLEPQNWMERYSQTTMPVPTTLMVNVNLLTNLLETSGSADLSWFRLQLTSTAHNRNMEWWMDSGGSSILLDSILRTHQSLLDH
ncbi:hypothetical protein IPH70_00570 [Candidatus Roizmanbacteria bacterium]|nr:MAG: hypothetical protein IPH70_00570 [Candidatus Roizmanbacteria bacterium]